MDERLLWMLVLSVHAVRVSDRQEKEYSLHLEMKDNGSSETRSPLVGLRRTQPSG